MFPLLRRRTHAPARGRGAGAAATSRRSTSTKFADVYPHMLSGGMKQRVAIARAHGDGAGHPADGRAVRRARRADPAQDAGGAAAALGRHALHRAVRHAFDRGGDHRRQPHPRALAASRPGQGRAQRRRLRHRDSGGPASAACSSASTTCSSPSGSRRKRRWPPMAERTRIAARAAVRPNSRSTRSDAAPSATSTRPLSPWERDPATSTACAGLHPGAARRRVAGYTRCCSTTR